MSTRKLRVWIGLWLAVASTLEPRAHASEGKVAAPAPARRLLHQLWLTNTLEPTDQPATESSGNFVILSPSLSFIDQRELSTRLSAARNRPIDEPLLAAIAQVVELYVRQHDYPAATVIVPPQNIASGVVRVAVLLGKVRNIKIAGNHWFSDTLLQEKLRIERGEIVRVSELNRSLAWTNTNPFRRVRMHVEPVPNTGEADLIIDVQERTPFRLSLSYDNTGNDVLGDNRYGAAVTYGNLWGKDHQISYQFSTTDDTNIFRAHGLEYRAPLPWRHVVMATAGYAQVAPTFFDGLITQKAESLSADLRYVAPVSRGRWQGELSATAGFKQTNNNLEFAGTPALNATTDLLTFTIAAAGMREDPRGRWLVSVNATGSPGQFNSRSSEEVYFDSRIGANPRFALGQISGVRLTRLTKKLTSTLRGMVQIGSTNLLPSEQLSLGGAANVRGYKERILGGDGGYTFTHELQHLLPSLPLGRKLSAMDTAIVLFWDYGRTLVKHPLVGQHKSDYLASVGAGFRASLSNNFSASIDVARQLEDIETPGEPHHRVHVKVSLAY